MIFYSNSMTILISVIGLFILNVIYTQEISKNETEESNPLFGEQALMVLSVKVKFEYPLYVVLRNYNF